MADEEIKDAMMGEYDKIIKFIPEYVNTTMQCRCRCYKGFRILANDNKFYLAENFNVAPCISDFDMNNKLYLHKAKYIFRQEDEVILIELVLCLKEQLAKINQKYTFGHTTVARSNESDESDEDKNN